MSPLEFDDRIVAQLEQAYRGRDMARRRGLVRDALGARPGDRVLDVGCGPGFFELELLEEVGPEGSVLGVDASGASIAVARSRSGGHDNVAFQEADATALPVGDAEFDRAFSVQVLEYVPDVDAALRELRRALRPGGRVVAWDVDWATVSMRTADEERMQRGAVHLGRAPRPSLAAAQPHRAPARAGFEDVRMEVHPFATNELSRGHLRRLPRPLRRAVRGHAGGRRPGRTSSAAGGAGRVLLRVHSVLLRGARRPARFEAVFRDDPPALELRGLTKRYDDGTLAVEDFDLEIPAGAFFGLLGPNGAGKTTLISAVCNLIRVSEGEVLVFGEPAKSLLARSWIGLAEQDINLDRFLTVRETLTYHGGYFGMQRDESEERAEEMIAAFGLQGKRDTRAPKLSGGQRRRLLLARALMHRPRLVILDEPTAGVDFELRTELWRYIRQLHAEGTTILLTTHYLEEAEELCEEIALIRDGRLIARDSAEGLRDELRRRPPAGRLRQGDGRGPRMTGMLWLCRRETLRVSKLWTQTVLAPVVSSLLFILVFGLSLGSRIKQVGDVDYDVFIVPGLITMAMAQAAYANNASSIFQARFDRYINDVLSAPMKPWQMTLGYTVGGLFRALAIGGALLACAAILVGVPVERPFALIAAVVLGLVLFASLGLVVGIYAETWDHTTFIANIVILPLAFVGGVFYSVDVLPAPWHELSHVNPVFYLVNAVRFGFLGEADVSVWLALGVTAALALPTYLWAQWLFTTGRKLKD